MTTALMDPAVNVTMTNGTTSSGHFCQNLSKDGLYLKMAEIKGLTSLGDDRQYHPQVSVSA